MDEDSTELVRQLYTRIGMLIEDATVIALELGAPQSASDMDEIAKLEIASETITQLLGAA